MSFSNFSKVVPFYGGGQVPNPANVIKVTAAPSTNAKNDIGTIAVDTSAGTAYMLVSLASGTATWAVLGGSAADVNTLGASAGTTTVSPSGGKITLASTANQITTTGSAATITFSLSSTLVAPGTVTATTGFTATAGGLTATLGDITASAGDLIATAGNVTASSGTITGDTFVTSSATLGTTFTDNSITPTGSDADISLLLSGKGAGSVVQTRSVAGGDVVMNNTNSDNTNNASNAYFKVATGGSSAGDAFINFLISSAGVYSLGIDNSDSDNFVLSASTSLGTSNLMTVSSTGDVTITGEVASQSVVTSGTNITFSESPFLQSNANTGAAPTGATGDVNLMYCQGGEIMQQFIIGGGQTIIAPRMTTTGLLTSLDLTNTEGAEYNFGVAANNKHQYTIGTSAAFYIELQVNAADIGGLDPFLVGFRLEQANSGTYTDYTDFAAIGARATTAADVVVIATDLNNTGETYTNTTDAWTDGQTKTFKVMVDAAGAVTYTIDGVAPTVTAAFTFDNGDVVCPFIHHVFGAASPGAINWKSLKIGLQ